MGKIIPTVIMLTLLIAGCASPGPRNIDLSAVSHPDGKYSPGAVHVRFSGLAIRPGKTIPFTAHWAAVEFADLETCRSELRSQFEKMTKEGLNKVFAKAIAKSREDGEEMPPGSIIEKPDIYRQGNKTVMKITISSPSTRESFSMTMTYSCGND